MSLAVVLLAIAIIYWHWFLITKPADSPNPLDVYSQHLCSVYFDYQEVHHSILENNQVKFIEPVLLELKSFQSERYSLDYSTKGDLDVENYENVLQANLSYIFNTPTGHGHRIFIRGRPGSGKTTLLKQLAKMWAISKQEKKSNSFIEDLSGCDVLLLVCLRDLWSYPDPRNITMEDLFTSIGSMPFLKYDIGKLMENVLESKVCLLLDGLDEYVPGYTRHNNYIYQIISGKSLKKATVIVTTRPESLSALARNYVMYLKIEIVGFDWDRVKAFVESYYSTKRSTGDQLLGYLKVKKVVRFMCYIPLYLHMLIYIHDEPSHKLPATPTEVYVSFTLQNLREELKNIDEDLPLTDQCADLSLEYNQLARCSPLLAKRFLAICQLAYNGIYNLIDNPLSASTEKPSTIAQFSKAAVPELLHNHTLGMLLSHQVIKPLRAIERVYTFQHLTFQQFFAAYHLTQITLKNQVNLITYPYFPGNMSTFFCGLYSFAVKNESLLYEVVNYLLTDLYVDSFPLAVQCVFESKHPGAVMELLKFNGGKMVLTCMHYATVVLSYPTMTKVTIQPYDDSFYEVAMEYIFNKGSSGISSIIITEDTCKCTTINWKGILGSIQSLQSLSLIEVSYCTRESIPMYLDIFSTTLAKVRNLQKVKFDNWPVSTYSSITNLMQKAQEKFHLLQVQFTCYFEELIQMDELLKMLSRTVCQLSNITKVTLHCATYSNLTFDQHVFDCYGSREIYSNLDANRFLENNSPAFGHCENWLLRSHEKSSANIELCGNKYNEAIEWVIVFEKII